jgi:mevalonate kinase
MDMYSSGLGGLIYLDSSSRPPHDVERFVLPDGYDIVIADTLTPRNTSDVISDKRRRYEAKEPQIMKYVETTEDLIKEIRELLKGSPIDIQRLGLLVHKSHILLRDHMGVSTNLLEEGVERSLKNGALGAKLTGTGMGGCLFALVPTDKTKGLVNSLSELPVKVYVTSPSEKGVTVDTL